MRPLATFALCSAVAVFTLSLLLRGSGPSDPSDPSDRGVAAAAAAGVRAAGDGQAHGGGHEEAVKVRRKRRVVLKNPVRQVYAVKPRLVADLVLDGTWNVVNGNGSINVEGAVPGTVHTALEAAGLIGDPYYGFNDVEYRWISYDNWTYSRSFTVGADLLSHRVIRLVCHGLDTVSTVSINGVQVGRSDNQFVGYVFDITDVLQVGENTIAVAFRSAVDYARSEFDSHAYVVPPRCPPPEYHPECHANFIRKAQCSFSWDWGPAFPTQGIWRTINVEAFDVATIRSVSPLPFKNADGVWQMNVTVYFDLALPSVASRGTLSVELRQLGVIQESVVTLGQGVTAVSVIVAAPQAEAWWPRGYGSQTLYDLSVTFQPEEAGTDPARYVLRTGFRTIELVEDPLPGGATLYFRVNDVPIFMKGSNWIPVDSFLDRVTYEHVRRLLEDGVEANMNTIRIWGGGVYESDDFYDMADELGLLIWQDMMFACSMYPVHEEFKRAVRQEMNYQVRRLARHPSLVAWTANNENEGALVDNWYGTGGANYAQYKSDYVDLYINTIRSEILTEDLSRPFLSSSPTNGKYSEGQGWISESPRPGEPQYGDVHYYNYWSDCLDYSHYPPTRYASEYGYQSWPAYDTLAQVAPADQLYIGSEFFNHREHHHEAGNGTDVQIRYHFDWPDSGDRYKDFKHYIYLTQVAQALCYQTETEFYRRSRSVPTIQTMGALYWQHNDIWQAPSWATIDYDGRWKMAHHFAVRFFADPLLSVVREGQNVAIYSVTDKLNAISDVSIIVQLWAWSSFVPLLEWTTIVTIEAEGSHKVFEQPLEEILSLGGCSGPEACVITTFAQRDGEALTETSPFYPVSWKDARGLADPNLHLISVVAVDDMTFNVTIGASAISVFTWLEAGEIAGHFSDNGFLLTSPSRLLAFHAAQYDVTAEELRGSITMTSLWDTFSQRRRGA